MDAIYFIIFSLLVIGLFFTIILEAHSSGIANALIAIVLVVAGITLSTSETVMKLNPKKRPKNEEVIIRETKKSEKLTFARIEDSKYRAFKNVVFKRENNQELSFKISSSILDKTTFKSDQEFVVYYNEDGKQRCSVLLMRNFIEEEVLSKEEVCYNYI